MHREFYNRKTDVVARDLLGKILIRRLNGELLEGKIVETEAYFGTDDPASRAFHGMKKYNLAMFQTPGHVFIYNVHKYWMLNIIAHNDGVGGVLIRAIEPIRGLKTMLSNRHVNKIYDLTNGPGKLTLALKVDKSLNEVDVTTDSNPIYVKDNSIDCKIQTSPRIGVTKDLPEYYRFYCVDNKFVSK